MERGAFGIQTKSLGRLFVKALAINPESAAATRLTKLYGQTDDYANIVYDVMVQRSPATGTLTVYDLNKYLDLIAEHVKENERKSKIFHQFFPLIFFTN